MSFLNIKDKSYVVFGIANRKSVAFHIAKVLQDEGAKLICSVQNNDQKAVVKKFFPTADCYLCNVEDETQIKDIAKKIGKNHQEISGLVHSIAFANYSEGLQPFHKTVKADFLQAMDISCFSFISLASALKPYFTNDASLITISISTTRMAAESYGYMAPVKAALNSSIVFLAKSLSHDTKIRVNGVGASLLKTSASAGIPGYIEPYLYAEQATLRKEALKTEEVANCAVFLLSSTSSGINAQTVVVDAGMSTNFFDKDIVKKAMS